jgi:hypothetical protein
MQIGINDAYSGLFAGVFASKCYGMTLWCLATTSVLHKPLLRYPVNLMGTDDEALRRRAYEMKREARDECQIVTGRWFQYLNIIGRNDFNRLDTVLEVAFSSLKSNFVSRANIVERTEKSVPVTGQSHIAPFARQSRLGKVTDGPSHASGGVTLNNDDVEPQARHLDFSNHIAFPQDMRFRETARLSESPHLESLIGVRISQEEAGVPQGESAEGEEKVADTTKDARSCCRGCSHWLRKWIHLVPDPSSAVGCFSSASE